MSKASFTWTARQSVVRSVFSTCTRDMDAIEKAIDATAGCKLLIMDPINAYLGKADSHKNAEVRQILGPVAEMCGRRGVAFIYLGHLNKTTNGPAMYRTAGSIAFVAAARVAHIVAEDKQDPALRLFLPVKNNLAPNIGGLSFRIEAVNQQPRVAWNDLPVTISADEALSLDNREAKNQRLQGHKEWLAAQLADGAKDADARSWRRPSRSASAGTTSSRPRNNWGCAPQTGLRK